MVPESEAKKSIKAESMIVPENNDMMREFVSSFLNIRPGGAFASNSDTSRPPRRRPVDVLAWKI